MEKEYEPYGPEWEKVMMSFKKKELVDYIRQLLKKNEKTYLDIYSAIAHAVAGTDADKDDIQLATESVIETIKEFPK